MHRMKLSGNIIKVHDRWIYVVLDQKKYYNTDCKELLNKMGEKMRGVCLIYSGK